MPPGVLAPSMTRGYERESGAAFGTLVLTTVVVLVAFGLTLAGVFLGLGAGGADDGAEDAAEPAGTDEGAAETVDVDEPNGNEDETAASDSNEPADSDENVTDDGADALGDGG